MTPEEAIMWLKDDIKEIDRDFADGDVNDAYAQEGTEIYKMAIEAIKEVQKYRMIENATIGEIVEVLKEFSEIGTVEECREAMKKQKGSGEMSNKRVIAVELTDKHIDILYHALGREDESCRDADEEVADAIIDLIEWAGEMI